MDGVVAAFEPLDGEHVREASWLDRPRDATDVSVAGPPIWRWRIPLRTPGLRLTAHIGSRAADRRSQDALLAVEYPGCIILAVADGVTPTDQTPTVDGIDGARYAAYTVLHHVAHAPPDADPERVLRTVNALLLDEFGPRVRNDLHPRDRPQTAVTIASVRLTADGHVARLDLARAGDCDLWVCRKSAWTLETPTPLLTNGPRRALRRWDALHPGASVQDRIRVEKRLLDHPSRWNLAALGRFKRPKTETATIEEPVDLIVLTTDGADISLLEDRDQIAARGRMPDLSPDSGRRDDVAMLHLETGVDNLSRPVPRI